MLGGESAAPIFVSATEKHFLCPEVIPGSLALAHPIEGSPFSSYLHGNFFPNSVLTWKMAGEFFYCAILLVLY